MPLKVCVHWAQAAFSSRQHRFVVCAAMPDGELNALTPARINQLVSAWQLRRQRDQPHHAAAPPCAVLLRVWKAQRRQRLGAAPGAAQIRSLDVHAQMLRSVRRLWTGRHSVQHCDDRLPRRAHCRRQPTGDAVLRKVTGHGRQGPPASRPSRRSPVRHAHAGQLTPARATIPARRESRRHLHPGNATLRCGPPRPPVPAPRSSPAGVRIRPLRIRIPAPLASACRFAGPARPALQDSVPVQAPRCSAAARRCCDWQ